MSHLRIALVAVAYLFCCGVHLSAQSSQVDYSFYEEVYNGTLAVYEYCEATNPQMDEYLSVEAGCSITNADGTQVWVANGGYQTEVSYAYNHYQPVKVFGDWSGYASYELSMSGDCCDGNGNSYYIDTDGFSGNGVQSCNVSSDETTCYLYGSGETEWLDYDPLRFAISTGTDYVDPVIVHIYPSSVSLDGGESQEFTVAVAGVPSGGSDGVTWTISGLAGGTESSNSSAYTYTAPPVISAETSLTLKACSIVAPSACSTPVTITLDEYQSCSGE
jgi:hypothetical protein